MYYTVRLYDFVIFSYDRTYLCTLHVYPKFCLPPLTWCYIHNLTGTLAETSDTPLVICILTGTRVHPPSRSCDRGVLSLLALVCPTSGTVCLPDFSGKRLPLFSISTYWQKLVSTYQKGGKCTYHKTGYALLPIMVRITYNNGTDYLLILVRTHLDSAVSNYP